MTKMTLGKELKILFDTIINNKLSIIMLIFLIFLAYIYLSTNKKNDKITKKLAIGIYLFLFLFILIAYHSHIFEFLDYMMNNFFIMIYFPNLAIYFAAIVISNIIVLVSIFNHRIDKLIKNINIVVYTIISFIFLLLIGVIIDKDLNIYSTKSIYGSTEAHGLISLTALIFMIWIIFLTIYHFIRKYQRKDTKLIETKQLQVVNSKPKVITKEVPVTKEVVVTKEVPVTKVVKQRILPSNIVEIKAPSTVKQSIVKTNIEEATNKEIERRIKESHVFDDIITKEEYIYLLELLKKEKRPKKVIRVDDQSALRRLQEMYESVR